MAGTVGRTRFPLYAQIIAGMLLGALVGVVVGKPAIALGDAGKLVIQIIKTLAAPLLFFAIVDAFLRSEIRARAGAWMILVSLTNATIALAVGLTLSNVLRPGAHLSLPSGAMHAAAVPNVERLDVGKTLAGYIPKNVVQPFLESSVMMLVLVAVLAGLALRRVKNEQLAAGEAGFSAVEGAVRTLHRATEVALGWVIRLVPFAVFGVVAKTVAEQGFAPLKGLAVYVGVALLGLAFQVGVVYQLWVKFVVRRPLRAFWAGALDAVVYALGASSSLATLPVTLQSLHKMEVSDESARLAACVGTNLNHDGILLYEAMAVLFVAQVYGVPMSLGDQIVAALACMLAGVGIAGVPEAGLVSLSLVLATVNLPIEILPLLLTVDWILSRARAATNVVSDIVVATVLDRVAPPEPAGAVGSPGVTRAPA